MCEFSPSFFNLDRFDFSLYTLRVTCLDLSFQNRALNQSSSRCLSLKQQSIAVSFIFELGKYIKLSLVNPYFLHDSNTLLIFYSLTPFKKYLFISYSSTERLKYMFSLLLITTSAKFLSSQNLIASSWLLKNNLMTPS